MRWVITELSKGRCEMAGRMGRLQICWVPAGFRWFRGTSWGHVNAAYVHRKNFEILESSKLPQSVGQGVIYLSYLLIIPATMSGKRKRDEAAGPSSDVVAKPAAGTRVFVSGKAVKEGLGAGNRQCE